MNRKDNHKMKISTIKGIGPKTEQLMNKIGIFEVQDLLSYYPRTYDLYLSPVSIEQLEEGRIMAVEGTISGNILVINQGRIPMTQVHITDGQDQLKLIWFRAPYIKSMLRTGQRIVVRGKITFHKGQPQIEHPELFIDRASYDKKIGTLQPMYSLTKGLTNNLMTKAIVEVMNQSNKEEDEDIFEESTLEKYNLIDAAHAIRGMHLPKDMEEFVLARKRMVFEEFVGFILSIQNMKEKTNEEKNHFVLEELSLSEDLIKKLPYPLTKAQLKVWGEIKEDIKNPKKVMSRLIQGDVGSGKTIVAILALLGAIQSGYQGALMAPTEVLAKQHVKSLKELFASCNIDVKIVLCTGSMTAKEKRIALEQIANGEAQIVIGTHALIQEKVIYKNLAMVITDEQHRFGVKQREELGKKGLNPHVLVMSATPIPRTLAIILYGELDISIIDELPANRLPIKNCVVGTDYRGTAYKFMNKQIQEGRQCYVICPMVEESEHLEGENVIDYASKLEMEFGSQVRVDYLHGKMKQSLKDEIMEKYYERKIDILVSTTVIEVGINVPNASTMLIENAERFGLSGLHQLRGRVGRGEHQSYCIFMSGTKSKETKERLAILGKSNDGFQIANEDLKLRGPGDLFGIRQSGDMNFQIGDIIQDASILKDASEAVHNFSEEEINRIMKKMKQIEKLTL